MLIEIAISISIICIISGLFFARTNLMSKLFKQQNASKNIETSVEALVSYLSNNSRLPCPSLDDSGFETPGCSSNLANCIGNLPYNTLGIPEKFSKDANCFPLKYIVDPNLTYKDDSIYTNKNEDFQNFFCASLNGRIFIENIENSIENPIIFVIEPSNANSRIENNTIIIPKNYNTFWIQRDLVLIKYFKSPPCSLIKKPQSPKNADQIFNEQLFDTPSSFSL